MQSYRLSKVPYQRRTTLPRPRCELDSYTVRECAWLCEVERALPPASPRIPLPPLRLRHRGPALQTMQVRLKLTRPAVSPLRGGRQGLGDNSSQRLRATSRAKRAADASTGSDSPVCACPPPGTAARQPAFRRASRPRPQIGLRIDQRTAPAAPASNISDCRNYGP